MEKKRMTHEQRLALFNLMKEQSEALIELTKDPDQLMDIICSYVSGGGTVVTLADTWQVPFGELSMWLNKDKDRQKRYYGALKDRGEYGSEVILKELKHLGLSDIRKIFNDDGSIKNIKDWDESISKAVAAVEVDELFEGVGREREQIGFTKRVKFWDKTKSLELLGKNLKLFVERSDHTNNTSTLEDLVVGSFQVEEKPNGEVKLLNEPTSTEIDKDPSDHDGMP